MSKIASTNYTCEGCEVASKLHFRKPSFVERVVASHRCDTCGSHSLLWVKRVKESAEVGIAIVRFTPGAGATKRTKAVKL